MSAYFKIVEKTLGSWINVGHCKAIHETYFKYGTSSCGPGLQKQRRTCNHGTFDKCTKADTLRQKSCIDAGTALPDCPKMFTAWKNDGNGCKFKQGSCGHGTQVQVRNCTHGMYSDGTLENCNDAEKNRTISCKMAGTQKNCPKEFGEWINNGTCCGPQNGPGIRKQIRDCLDGTTQKCKKTDTTQTAQCWSNYGTKPCHNYGGISNAQGDVCCDSRCGECGGSKCNKRYGISSGEECCIDKIIASSKICGEDKHKAPCIQKERKSLPPCEQKFGDWKNDGACVATEKHGGLCGPQLGKQKQKRTCQDGTNDKCTEENTNQEIDCTTSPTRKEGHHNVEHMEKTCGGKIPFCRIIGLVTGLIYEG